MMMLLRLQIPLCHQVATYSVDEKGNLIIAYADKSIDKIAAAYLVTICKDSRSGCGKNDPTAKAQTVTPGSTPTAPRLNW